MKLISKLLLGVLLLGTLTAIVAANFQRDPEFALFKWRVRAEAPTDVRLAPAARGRIVQTIEVPGKVEADVEVKVSGQVVGRIVELPLKEGDAVRKDDLLVQLDRVQYQADVRSAEARIVRLKSSIALTEADLEKSKRDAERNRRLFSDRAVSQSDMADVQTLFRKDQARLEMARAELGEAEAALVRAKEDLQRTTIRSSLNGIVSQLLAKEGEVVVIGTMNNAGTVIMTVSDPTSMVVRARVDENNIALVKPGQHAVVHLQNNDNTSLTGRVLRISPKGIKPGGATASQVPSGGENEVAIFETIIGFDSPVPAVRLGMNATVDIQVDERADVLSVPSSAVLHRRARDLPRRLADELQALTPRGPGVKDPSRRYHQVVFVNEGGLARCRLVQTGISDESRVELLAGLKEGEQIIAGPYRVFEKLKDGKPVAELNVKDEPEE